MASVFSNDIESIKAFGAEMVGECVYAGMAVLMAFCFTLYLSYIFPLVTLGVVPIC